MVKKTRNDAIFIKPDSIKLKKPKIINKNKKVFKRKDFNSLSKFSLASVLVILSFFGLPVITNFLSENLKSNLVVTNFSKKKFDLAINKKIIIIDDKNDQELSLENIYDDIDIFISEEDNSNTIRFSASTIEQLFEDTKYNLKVLKKQNL